MGAYFPKRARAEMHPTKNNTWSKMVENGIFLKKKWLGLCLVCAYTAGCFSRVRNFKIPSITYFNPSFQLLKLIKLWCLKI